MGESINGTATLQEQLSTYRNALTQLDEIVADLNKEQQNVRLLQLRSVRSYKAQVEQYTYVLDELEKNEAQLEKARQGVAHLTWFFNNQELSTRALEKQDPEVFAHWSSSETRMGWLYFKSRPRRSRPRPA